MRAILIDWIIVVHDKFHLKWQTLYQTIWLIDTYLSIKFIKRSDFKLLGIANTTTNKTFIKKNNISLNMNHFFLINNNHYFLLLYL